jgi:hypothetical protein
MTLNELIERLEDLRSELGGDVEVRLMTQRNYPFENELAGATCLRDIHERDEVESEDDDEDAPPELFDPEGDPEEVVYLLEGRQLGYGTTTAWFLRD